MRVRKRPDSGTADTAPLTTCYEDNGMAVVIDCDGNVILDVPDAIDLLRLQGLYVLIGNVLMAQQGAGLQNVVLSDLFAG